MIQWLVGCMEIPSLSLLVVFRGKKKKECYLDTVKAEYEQDSL